jgi:hypothetical protein
MPINKFTAKVEEQEVLPPDLSVRLPLFKLSKGCFLVEVPIRLVDTWG